MNKELQETLEKRNILDLRKEISSSDHQARDRGPVVTAYARPRGRRRRGSAGRNLLPGAGIGGLCGDGVLCVSGQRFGMLNGIFGPRRPRRLLRDGCRAQLQAW